MRLHPVFLPNAIPTVYSKDMNTLKELETAVIGLPPNDLASFRAWFAEFDAHLWDTQLAQDIAHGRLETFADEAIRENHEGRTKSL